MATAKHIVCSTKAKERGGKLSIVSDDDGLGRRGKKERMERSGSINYGRICLSLPVTSNADFSHHPTKG